MPHEPQIIKPEDFSHRAVEAALKIGLLFVLLNWCFHIAKPFINPLAWGVIIAVALYPLHQKLTAWLGEREKLSAALMTGLLLLIILGPCGILASIIGENVRELADSLQQNQLIIPQPPEKVVAWPVIGEPLFNFWQLAANNFGEALKTFAPQLKQASKWLLTSGAMAIMAILQLLVSVIICGLLLINGDSGHRLALAIGRRLAGKKGEEWTELCIATIRGVARGILGVALIQAVLAGVGFFLAGVPAAGLLTVFCLFLAVAQLPTLILFLPCIIYVFSHQDTLTATVFMVWMLGVGAIDSVLKPILMGRGLDLPMAVVFIGAIGGMIFSGIIGLFVGAVVLALGYKLFLSWLKETNAGY